MRPIFVEIGTLDEFLFATQHLEQEIKSYGPAQGFYRFEYTSNVPHALNGNRIRKALSYVYSKLDLIETVGTQDLVYRVFPNLVQAEEAVLVDFEPASFDDRKAKLRVFDMNGKQISERPINSKGGPFSLSLDKLQEGGLPLSARRR